MKEKEAKIQLNCESWLFPVWKMNELCYCCIIWTGWWRRLWPAEGKVKYKWLIPASRERKSKRQEEREREPVCWWVTLERCALHLIHSVLCLRHNPVFSTKSFSSLAPRMSLTCLGSGCLSILIHSSVPSPKLQQRCYISARQSPII